MDGDYNFEVGYEIDGYYEPENLSIRGIVLQVLPGDRYSVRSNGGKGCVKRGRVVIVPGSDIND